MLDELFAPIEIADFPLFLFYSAFGWMLFKLLFGVG
jgi:hypothetical protein